MMQGGDAPPPMDALAKLEMAVRPQSVPSWLSSDSNHAPKVTALGPRSSSVEYMDATKSGKGASSSGYLPTTSAPTAAAAAAPTTAAAPGSQLHHRTEGTSSSSGPSATSVRPRAPILMQKEATHEGEFLSEASEHAAPKRSRQRARHQTGNTKSRWVPIFSGCML